MNQVRAQLSAGIPADQADSFRQSIRQSIQSVEQICAQNKIRPEVLTSQSYNAYRFLKSIDLEHLPIADGNSVQTTGPLHINNLVKISNELHEQFARIVAAEQQGTLFFLPDQQPIPMLLEHIRKNVAIVQEIAAKQNLHPSQLPKPSRQAYEWLVFLSSAENLCDHLETLRSLRAHLLQQQGQNANATLIEFRLDNMDGLWHAQACPDNRRRVTLNEGFLSAPSTVQSALAQLVHQPRSEQIRTIAREYAETEDFGEIVSNLLLSTAELEPNTRGQHHDLRLSFQRVNAQYFGSRVSSPRLVWNRTLTFRTMGHYQPTIDTVMISMTLDDAQVPSFVLDHVMHHELLHKVLGAQMVNGQRRVHTPEFRAAERRFREYTQAEIFLKQWARRFASTGNDWLEE